ncbi:MAG TPA: hypothetical protein ENK24_03185 [Anaerolineae bacterium]|nr:hypothetical protein [Anaerolineae bacterium]
MIERTPDWLLALLKKYHQAEPASAPKSDIAALVFERLKRRAPLSAAQPAPAGAGASTGQTRQRKRDVHWYPAVSRSLSRLPHAERNAIDREVDRLSWEPAAGRYALDHCDAFREVTVGRYKLFYLTRGDRIDITGLKRVVK